MRHLLAVVVDQENPDPVQKAPGIGEFSLPLLLLALFMAFYFILIRPMKQREKRDREDILTKLKKNDEVLTASGIIGIVAMIKDDEVVLKVDETSSARLRVLKTSVVRILNPKEPAKEAAAKVGQDGKSS